MQVASLVARGFQRYWRLTRGLYVGVAGCLIDSDGRVLLTREPDRTGWHLPQGIVRRGETLEAALTRKLGEDICIAPTARPELFWIYAESAGAQPEKTGLFVVRRWRTLASTPPSDVEFFSPAALPSGTTPTTTARIHHVLEGRAPFETC